MVNWTIILAAMLFLQPPGASYYSKVSAEPESAPAVMGEVNGRMAYRLLQTSQEPPPQCSQPGNVACSHPRKRDFIYNGNVLRTGWRRVETYDEGVLRYATIAQAIAKELNGKSWSFPAGQSWRYLVTIAYHESGFRRDIHSGYGSDALGDCRWTGKIGKSKRIKNSCRSHGLFQTLFDPPLRKKILGWHGRDIVGTSMKRTRRAVRVAAHHLDRLDDYCQSAAGMRPYCVLASYGGVTASADQRILVRVDTLLKIKQAPKTLDPYVAALVGHDGDDKPAELAVR